MSDRHFKLSARAISMLDAMHSAGRPCRLRDLNDQMNVGSGESLRGIVKQLLSTGHVGGTLGDTGNVREYFLTAKGRAVRKPAEARLYSLARSRDAYSTSGVYQGTELMPYTGRPRANECLDLPSRFGNQLRWRDGRVRDLAPEEHPR